MSIFSNYMVTEAIATLQSLDFINCGYFVVQFSESEKVVFQLCVCLCRNYYSNSYQN